MLQEKTLVEKLMGGKKQLQIISLVDGSKSTKAKYKCSTVSIKQEVRDPKSEHIKRSNKFELAE